MNDLKNLNSYRKIIMNKYLIKKICHLCFRICNFTIKKIHNENVIEQFFSKLK